MAKRWMLAAITAAGLGYSGQARAEAVASFSASRTSGVAPLAVYFDAQTSTCENCEGVVDAWHDLGYRWDFGDPDAGTWAISGRSKARDTGPATAHVFERPGTYTVSLTATDPVSGETATTTVDIEVTDPDEVFAGEATRCYRASEAGDFAGCPEGAQQKTLASFNAVIADCKGEGRRCLLRRGDTFTASDTINLGGDAPRHIGAFGRGDRPRIDAKNLGAKTLLSGVMGGADYRVVDLSFAGPSVSSAKVLGAKQVQRDVLFLRNEAVAGTWHNFVEMEQTQLGAKGWHERMFFVDNTVLRAGFGAGGNIVFVTWKSSAILGNDFQDTTNGEHIIRAGAYDGLVIAHNRLGPADNIRHVITFRSPDFDEPCEGGVCAPSRRGVILANTIHITNGWTVQVCGQAENQNQQCEDTLVEGNFAFVNPQFAVNTDPIVVFNLADQTTRRTSFRNNICNLTGAAIEHCADLKVGTLARAIGNTCYRADGNDLICVHTAGQAPDDVSAVARNNLGFTGGGGQITVVSGGWGTVENNSKPAMNPFMVAMPGTDPADYMLRPDAAAVDGGIATANGFDFAGRPRPAGAAHDIGAWELGAVDEPLGVLLTAPPSPIAVDNEFALSAVTSGGAGSPSFAWDCDGDGSFELETQADPQALCPGLPAGVYTLAVQATDSSGVAVDTAELEVAGGCGDGVIGPGEVCDGADLGGETCASQGFAGGALACATCGSFDTSGCTPIDSDGEASSDSGTPTTGTPPDETGAPPDDPTTAPTGLTDPPDLTDASTDDPQGTGDGGGCGCRSPRDPAAAALLPLALALLRRRRR